MSADIFKKEIIGGEKSMMRGLNKPIINKSIGV
jgi:hypothetical protein